MLIKKSYFFFRTKRPFATFPRSCILYSLHFFCEKFGNLSNREETKLTLPFVNHLSRHFFERKLKLTLFSISRTVFYETLAKALLAYVNKLFYILAARIQFSLIAAPTSIATPSSRVSLTLFCSVLEKDRAE